MAQLPTLHAFNPNEGNGQSHTHCGAKMEPEEYKRMMGLEIGQLSTCERCDSIAREIAIYEYWNDI